MKGITASAVLDVVTSQLAQVISQRDKVARLELTAQI
jgi:hypothetical protein